MAKWIVSYSLSWFVYHTQHTHTHSVKLHMNKKFSSFSPLCIRMWLLMQCLIIIIIIIDGSVHTYCNFAVCRLSVCVCVCLWLLLWQCILLNILLLRAQAKSFSFGCRGCGSVRRNGRKANELVHTANECWRWLLPSSLSVKCERWNCSGSELARNKRSGTHGNVHHLSFSIIFFFFSSLPSWQSLLSEAFFLKFTFLLRCGDKLVTCQSSARR